MRPAWLPLYRGEDRDISKDVFSWRVEELKQNNQAADATDSFSLIIREDFLP